MTRTLALCMLTLGACTPEPTGPRFFEFTFENITAPGALVDSEDQPHDIAFAPAILIAHSADFVLFEPGQASAWSGFEAITEDGNNVALINELRDEPSVSIVQAFARVDADYSELPLMPGQSVSATIQADEGELLTWVSMYGQSNDVFVGMAGVDAFVEGEPLSGDVTDRVGLYDGGTEVNEEPGVGENQPGRQARQDTGPDENGVVTAIDGTDSAGYTYPAPDEMLRLSVLATDVLLLAE